MFHGTLFLEISAMLVYVKALNELTIEDPSLRVTTDGEFGQTIIEGMGELHIEVVKDRLKRDYGLNVFMGPLQVSPLCCRFIRECCYYPV